jgi:hypothetical protein
MLAVMALTPQHTYQVPTKRPERMVEYCSSTEMPYRVDLVKEVIKAGRIAAYNTKHEESKPIVGWDGYFITSYGRVFSDRTNAGKRDLDALHEIKPQYGPQGHARVMLQNEGKKCRRLIHRMVLEHFDRLPFDGEQGCHLDGDATNNALWNLKWGTQKDNWDDSKRHGNRRRHSKLSEKQVELIREKLKCCHTYSMLAKEYGVSETQISNINKGLQWAPEYLPDWPLENCWLGVTVENQKAADERRVPLKALAEQGWFTWVSHEPALEQVDFTGWEFIRWLVMGGESGHY